MKNKIIIKLDQKRKIEFDKPNLIFARNFNSILSINNFVLKLMLAGFLLALFPIILMNGNITKTYMEIGVILISLYTINKVLSKVGIIPQFSYDLAIFGFTSIIALSLLFNTINLNNAATPIVVNVGLTGSVIFVFVLLYVSLVTVFRNKTDLEKLMILFFASPPLMFIFAWIGNYKLPEALTGIYLLFLPGIIWYVISSNKHKWLYFINYAFLLIALLIDTNTILQSLIALTIALNTLFALKKMKPFKDKKTAGTKFSLRNITRHMKENQLAYFSLLSSIPVVMIILNSISKFPNVYNFNNIVAINIFPTDFNITNLLIGAVNPVAGSFFLSYITSYGILSLTVLLLILAKVLAELIKNIQKNPINENIYSVFLINLLVLFPFSIFLISSDLLTPIALLFILMGFWVLGKNISKNISSKEWGEVYSDYKFIKNVNFQYFMKFLQTCSIVFIIIVAVNIITYLERINF